MRIFFLAIIMLTATININGQELDTIPQTEEYAVVKAILYYNNNTFVGPGLIKKSPNPTLQMGDKSFAMKNFIKSKTGEDFYNHRSFRLYEQMWMVTSFIKYSGVSWRWGTKEWDRFYEY